jgi:hypothetical protein
LPTRWNGGPFPDVEASPGRLLPPAMKFVFFAYLMVITSGIAYFTVIGLIHH